eukprot:1153210-Pelagomonas_calceolata.AAC.6
MQTASKPKWHTKDPAPPQRLRRSISGHLYKAAYLQGLPPSQGCTQKTQSFARACGAFQQRILALSMQADTEQGSHQAAPNLATVLGKEHLC